MLRRTIRKAALPLTLAIAACGDGLSPETETGNVEAIIGATVLETDTGVAVAGEWTLSLPHYNRALWLDRYVRYDFGGFPDLDYPQDTRFSESWRLRLEHQNEPITRNDSTIFSYVDHGDAAVADSAMDKHTTRPHVSPGSTVGFDSFVSYLRYSYWYVTWLAGNTTTFHDAPYHDPLMAGEAIALTTTGSLEANPVSTTFAASPFSTLVELRSGDTLSLNARTPPIVSVNRALIFGFDRALDPERVYAVFIPWPKQGSGAQRAFFRPRVSTDRLVIPAATLAELIENATLDPEQEARLEKELSGILDWVAQLDELDTGNVEPMTRVAAMTMKKRKDEVTDGFCAADILKKAMIGVETALRKEPIAKMLLTVHDELLFEVPTNKLDDARELIEREMTQAATLRCGLAVEVHSATNWADAHA